MIYLTHTAFVNSCQTLISSSSPARALGLSWAISPRALDTREVHGAGAQAFSLFPHTGHFPRALDCPNRKKNAKRHRGRLSLPRPAVPPVSGEEGGPAVQGSREHPSTHPQDPCWLAAGRSLRGSPPGGPRGGSELPDNCMTSDTTQTSAVTWKV